MSLEYPPTTITGALNWKKDIYDRYPAHTNVTYDDANGTLLTFKTVVSDSPYGNGEYKAFGNDWLAYTEGTSYGANEWPANGPFEKSEGDSNSRLSFHSASVGMSTTTDMSNPLIIGIEMPDHIKLTSYSIKTRPGFNVRSPKKWKLYGRRNCGTWILIETREVSSWTSGQTKSWNISPSEYYSDYRLDFLTAYNSSLQIYTIKFYGTPEQMTTPISFDRLGNLPFTRTSIYNKTTTSAITLEHGLKDLADINNTTVMSLDLLQDPTMYNGKFYVPNSGSHTEYFPSEFSTTPGVFFTLEWDVWGAGNGTRKNLVITTVTTKYFTITNPQSNMDPIVHWMAVKPGTGNIYGKNYKCEVVSSGNNWGTNRTFTYSSMGNDPFVMYCVNSRNSGSNVYTTSYNTISSTQALFYTGVNADSDVRNNQTVSTSEQLAYLSIKNSGDVVNKMYMWTGTEKSVAYNAHTTTTNGAALQNAICLGLVKAGGGNATTLYANRVTDKRVKWYIKEYVGMDGTHSAEPTVMLQIAGTTTRTSKPLFHLDATYLNAIQGVSTNSQIDRWYNLSQRGFKYAVGRGSTKPTLKSDSNGYYVDFNYTGAYFDLPSPITWKFADVDGVGTKGLTCFAVAKFNDIGSTTSDNFFDCCNPGAATSTETINGSTYYKAINEGTSNFGGTIYNNAQKKTSWVELTTAGNSQNGEIQWSGINPGDRMYTTFDTWIGGGNGADALWFYWGCTTRPTGEDFNSGGYLLAIDEYGTNELQLEFNNSRLHTKVIGNIDDSTWHSWIVEYKNNTITVTRDGTQQFSKVDNTSRTLSTLVGWGARTGGLNNRHLVRNMKLWVSANNGTGYIDNGSPHTDRLLWGRTNTQLKLQATDPSVQYDTTNYPATVTYRIHTIRYNNPDKTSSIWTIGEKLTPTETTQNTIDNRTTTRNVIGANADLSTSNMKLRELIVFDDILTDTQIDTINTHLSSKWGVNLVYPGTQTSAYSDLIAWYRCEETSGSTLADSKGSHNMTLYNSGYYTHNASDSVDQGERSITFTRSSTAKAYDSSSLSYGLAKLSNLGSININQFSVSCWVKFTQNSYHGTLWQFSSPSSYHQVFFRLAYIVDGGGYWTVLQRYKETSGSTNYNDAVQTSSGAVNYHNNVWHNLVVTKSGNTTSDTLKLYINGSLAGSTNLTNSGGKDFSGKIDHLAFGAGWHYNKWNWWSKDMKTDDYRIYNRALTSSEVSEIYSTK